MTTKTYTNGHIMTGIGFSECPECEAPWTATPTVEEIVKSWLRKEEDSYAYVNDEYLENAILDGGFNFEKLITTLETYGQSRYEEGVKVERKRCEDLVVAHLRTNTYDGNDALVFKTTVEEVVKLLSDNTN